MIKNKIADLGALTAASAIAFGCIADENSTKGKTLTSEAVKPYIIAHYMSWYQTPDFSGSWGFWQINRKNIDKKYWHNPENRNPQGWRDISSVFYPVIGPYDSADPALCEYHILLAKLAGIDAFVADW